MIIDINTAKKWIKAGTLIQTGLAIIDHQPKYICYNNVQTFRTDHVEINSTDPDHVIELNRYYSSIH